MKKITILISFTCILTCFFTACKKDTIVDNATQLGISRITYFALLTLTGNQNMSLVKGQTYTDPGCNASIQGKSTPITVTGTVNTNQVGLYTLTYSAKNADGYPASTTRTVAVLPSAEVAGVDISGSYYYIATPANTSTVTKLAPGFYSASNCFSAATTIPISFICADGTNIIIPNQSTAYGPIVGTGTLAADSSLTYKVSLSAQGISNSSRKWHMSK